MKRQTPKLVSLCLLAGLAVAPACAQAGGTKVNVPFDFILARKTFSAGQYVVVPAQGRVRIQNSSRRTIAVVATDALSGRVPDANGRVVFNCYADRCFLSQVWVPGQVAGRGVPKSKLEIELAQKQTGQQFALLGVKSPR